MNVKPAYTIWLGALARLDFLSSTTRDKTFTFFLPPNVTLHRTPTHKAIDVFMKHAGTLLRPVYDSKNPLEETDFVQHEIGLTCEDHVKANFDIVIEGLGWFSIQGKGFVSLMLYLPKNVKYHIRKDPMFPFEVKEKGLKRYNGNTVNSNTKKNQKMAERYRVMQK
jgi:30S ribosome assembly GTPase